MNTMYICFVHMNIVSGVKKFTLNIAQIIFFSTTTLQDYIIVVASIETPCSVEYEILII